MKRVHTKYPVKLVWSTDWHLSDSPPGRRRDDYRQALMDKLEFVSKLANELDAPALCGGDVFHIKNPKSTANSFSLLSELIHKLRTFPTNRVYGAIGNHDLMWDRMDSLGTQPLGLIIAAQAYHDLTQEPVLFVNGVRGGTGVLVEAFPYAEGVDTLQRLQNAGKRPSEDTLDVEKLYRVGIVHAYGQPGGEALLWGERKIGYDELKDLDFDYLLWGHDHSRHEPVKVGNVTHLNSGSMARAAFSYDEADRPVVATVLSFDKNGSSFEEKPIPVKPLELAFTVADKGVEAVAKSDEVTEFFTEMDEAVEGIESNDPREVLTQLCPDKNLLSLIYDLCEL
jgi:DNA repair exonuclease SbcCD nuclease subunit